MIITYYNKMKVLIVDDSLLAEHALKSYFVKLNHEVVGLAKNGDNAKELYEKKKPDIVTVDRVMPGIDGVELIKYINKRDTELGRRTRILMISSDQIPHEEKNKIKVDKYIIKPVTLNKIKTTIEEIL